MRLLLRKHFLEGVVGPFGVLLPDLSWETADDHAVFVETCRSCEKLPFKSLTLHYWHVSRRKTGPLRKRDLWVGALMDHTGGAHGHEERKTSRN